MPMRPDLSPAWRRPISRRTFARLGAAAIGGAAASCLGLAGCSTLEEAVSGTRTLTDDTGRLVELPTAARLRKVYFTSPLAQIFCFTMAPDLIAGTAIAFTAEQLEYLPAGSENLVFMGSLAQGGTIDAELLSSNGVQLVFSISGTNLTDVNVADALRLEDETGVPVFLIDGSFDRIGDTYRLLGECFGRRERAEELAAYCERIYADVTSAVAQVPESERVRYYFAEGPEGLQTEPNSSEHSLAFRVAGGVNVAADAPLPAGRSDMAEVTVDQVAAWDPEFIIAWDWQSRGGADRLIRASSEWAGISAVRAEQVHSMPHVPFPFCDRPPGVNRFLGIQWLANLFYPTYYDVDMVSVVRDFCATCYWRDISTAQAEAILGA